MSRRAPVPAVDSKQSQFRLFQQKQIKTDYALRFVKDLAENLGFLSDCKDEAVALLQYIVKTPELTNQNPPSVCIFITAVCYMQLLPLKASNAFVSDFLEAVCFKFREFAIALPKDAKDTEEMIKRIDEVRDVLRPITSLEDRKLIRKLAELLVLEEGSARPVNMTADVVKRAKALISSKVAPVDEAEENADAVPAAAMSS